MIMNASKKRSIQGRVACAILVNGLRGTRIEALKREGVITLGGCTLDQTRKDLKVMEAGQNLCIPFISHSHFDENVLHDVVMFILSKDVSTISCGTKKIKLSNEEKFTLPSLTRRKSPKHIYKGYLAWCNERETNCSIDDPCQYISRGKFYNTPGQITAGGEKMLAAVDYVTSLVNDQVTLLQCNLLDADLIPVMTNYTEIMRIYLKQHYDSHSLQQYDEVGTHGISYGFSKPDLSTPARTRKCNACNFVNFCTLELQKSVRAASKVLNATISEDIVKDAVKVIKDASQKFELYQGHRVRVANQQVQLEKIVKEMEQQCLLNKGSSEALIVADLKMKFESMSSHEISQQHFAKQGIRWHGFLCSYFTYEEQEVDDVNGTRSVMGSAIRYTVYCDQI